MLKPDNRIKINNNRFVAIDFETANSQRNSACSIGLAIIENLEIIETKHWLIQPPELYFSPFNISIHGITEADVAHEPTFDRLWPEIRTYIDNNLIIAHNASFDMNVLRYILGTYDIDYPESYFSCTWRISKKIWKGLYSYSLGSVSNHLKIEFKHHDAREDARACAQIAIDACIEKNTETLPDLLESISLGCGYIGPGDYTPVRNDFSYNRVRIRDIKPECDIFNRDHPFYNKKLIFTGTLKSMSRKEAMQAIVNLGGRCTNTISKSIDYLIIGIQDHSRLKDIAGSSKMKKAYELSSQGYNLKIIEEDDFLELL